MGVVLYCTGTGKLTENCMLCRGPLQPLRFPRASLLKSALFCSLLYALWSSVMMMVLLLSAAPPTDALRPCGG